MSENKGETDNTECEETNEFDLNEFFNIPEVGHAIPKLVELWAKSLDIRERTLRRESMRFVAMTLI